MDLTRVCYGNPGEEETITATTASVGMTATTYAPTTGLFGTASLTARYVLIEALTGDLNFTLNGTAPTATAGTNKGLTLLVGDTFLIEGYDAAKNFRCINAVASSGAVCKAQPFF